MVHITRHRLAWPRVAPARARIVTDCTDCTRTLRYSGFNFSCYTTRCIYTRMLHVFVGLSGLLLVMLHMCTSITSRRDRLAFRRISYIYSIYGCFTLVFGVLLRFLLMLHVYTCCIIICGIDLTCLCRHERRIALGDRFPVMLHMLCICTSMRVCMLHMLRVFTRELSSGLSIAV